MSSAVRAYSPEVQTRGGGGPPPSLRGLKVPVKEATLWGWLGAGRDAESPGLSKGRGP